MTKSKVRSLHLPTKPINTLPKRAESQLHNGVYYGTTEERIAYIASRVMFGWLRWQPTLVVVEEYAFSRHSRALSGLHELGGVVKHYLWLVDALWHPVSSMTAKKEATNHGHSGKDAVLAAAREMWPECKNDDLADAFWLALYGMRNFGRTLETI